jgi:hypothetical protein
MRRFAALALLFSALLLVVALASPARAQNAASAETMTSAHYTLTPVPGGIGTTASQSDHFRLVGGVGLGSPSAPIVTVKGDINGNGGIDLPDVLAALKIALHLVTPTPHQIAVGDVAPLQTDGTRGDGVINIADATLLLKVVVGLIKI